MTEPKPPQDHKAPQSADEAPAEEEASNRAARRARGKKPATPANQWPGQEQRFHGRTAQARRSYSNRRSG